MLRKRTDLNRSGDLLGFVDANGTDTIRGTSGYACVRVVMWRHNGCDTNAVLVLLPRAARNLSGRRDDKVKAHSRETWSIRQRRTLSAERRPWLRLRESTWRFQIRTFPNPDAFPRPMPAPKQSFLRVFAAASHWIWHHHLHPPQRGVSRYSVMLIMAKQLLWILFSLRTTSFLLEWRGRFAI